MSDERCPLCGGREIGYEDHGVEVWPAQYECDDCYYSWQGGNGAYFEPRYRLPTEAEERAHAETWGKGAGWMVRFTDISRHPTPFVIVGLTQWGAVDLSAKELRSAWEGDVELGAQVQSYPIAPDGRPVGWPTVKEEC